MTDVPAQIGPYRVDGEIGRGGMGVVYCAHDDRLHRTVAIKSLPDHLAANPEHRLRFAREARTLASVSHPNVAQIYGVEEQGDRSFLVLEFVEGETLEDRLAGGRLPVDAALEIALEIARGLEAAHHAGVVHRDLKPANVKITPDGSVKVLDFGLAKAAGADSSVAATQSVTPTMTAPGAIMGTAPYMSPEQARGREVDERSDIWAFGVILYECLTGSNPYRSDTVMESIACVLRDQLSMDALPADTPIVVREILVRCLRHDPKRRLGSVRDLVLLLEDLDGQGPASSDRAGANDTIVEGRFPLTDELIRSLEREGFDPRLVGWDLRYADNRRRSENLVVWIPSFGGDHATAMWHRLMSECPHRMVVVSLVGLEPGVESAPWVSAENQLRILRAFAAWLRRTERPARLIVAGFSCGADYALRVAAGADPGLIDGIASVDPNLERSTCFLTGMFSELDPDDAGEVLSVLRRCYDGCESVNDWLMLSEHMINCVSKFDGDCTPLIRQGRDIAGPFASGAADAESPFAEWYREASQRVRAMRFLFADYDSNRRVLGAIRLRHLEDGCLGDRFDEASIAFTRETGHMELLEQSILLNAIDAAIDACRA